MQKIYAFLLLSLGWIPSIQAQMASVKGTSEATVSGHATPGYSTNHVLSSLPASQPFVEFMVSGTITDDTGQGMPGVNIIERSTTTGTTTDAEGKYKLNVSGPEAVLVISFIGYATQEITVSSRSVIDIKLAPEVSTLNEVVVVGYGTSTKANLTGSVATISDKDVKSVTTMSLTDNMAGKIPGLRVMQRSSEPGEYNSSFDIRGWGTPLIIVDGIQRDNFAKLDPNEIASVTVLKDASAAIYGVKAANGVILITTKKGSEGKTEISYTGTYGWQNATKYLRPMNAAEFTESYNWAQVNSGIAPSYSQQQIDDYRSGKLPSADWYNELIRDNSPQQHHNITMSGGSAKVKYFGSLGYFDQEGLFKSGDLNYKRFNIRSNVTVQLTDNLEAELGLGGISDVKKAPSTSSWEIYKEIWMQVPTLTVYANNNPLYLQALSDGRNPYADSHSDITGYSDTFTKTFQGNFALNYKIPKVDGLKARFLFGHDYNNYTNKTFRKQYPLYTYDAASDKYNPSYINSPSNMSESFTENTKTTMQLSLNYEHTFNSVHNVKGLLLYENLRVKNNNFYGNRQFTVDAVDELYAGNSVQQFSSDPNGIYELANQGIIGRVNYDYNSKYLIEASFRYDGSSKFPEGKRWGFFPAVSAGWRISEENFIIDNLPFVSNLKIRASYGKMGDDAASSFQFIPGYTYPTSQTFNGRPLSYMFNGNLTTGLGFIGMVNPNITWYEATTSNIGVDAALWNGKLTVQYDMFHRKRRGLLDTRILSLPKSVGASLPQENLNSDVSHGFELVLGTNQEFQGLRFNISGMFAYTQTRWEHKEQAAAGNSYLNWRNSVAGRNNNIIWGYELNGQFQNQDEINAAAIEDGQGNRFVLPGDLRYRDVNGDGIIDDLDVVPIAKGTTADKVVNTQSIPQITYGMNIGLTWKRFDATILFQGASQYSVQLVEQLAGPYSWGRNGLAQFYDAWHRADNSDLNSQWISGEYPPMRLSGVNPNGLTSPYNIKDATYLRLKSVEVGYTVSARFLTRIGVEKLRVFTNGFNLVTWTKLPMMDPEHPQDLYGYMYPITRNMNLGLDLTF
ncbi:TonB-dependent receptor [Chryseolinea sp. T2]|uniref:SusC/RagA family TonB-linked outer membrane protein n=1 Tax=Chryseolinea sp. T2 TaxID=3129255 RepID=UPI0030778F06